MREQRPLEFHLNLSFHLSMSLGLSLGLSPSFVSVGNPIAVHDDTVSRGRPHAAYRNCVLLQLSRMNYTCWRQ